MNKDFRVAVTWRRGRKRRRLIRRLGEKGALALVDLWAFTAESRPDGLLTGLSDEDIAEEAGWPVGDADRFIKTLKDESVKFLCDPCAHCQEKAPEIASSPGPYVHGWHEHNAYCAGAKARSEAARVAGKASAEKRLQRAAGSGSTAQLPGFNSSPSPPPSPPPSPGPSLYSTEPSSEPPVFEIECLKGHTFNVSRKQIREWGMAYPALDVELEVRRAILWLEANPRKRKTHRGMPQFLNNWLQRAQNSGGGLRSNRPKKERTESEIRREIRLATKHYMDLGYEPDLAHRKALQDVYADEIAEEEAKDEGQDTT